MNAQHRILTGDGIGAHQANQVAAGQRQPAATRLAGKKAVAALSHRGQNRFERRSLKMMKKQIDNDEVPALRPWPAAA